MLFWIIAAVMTAAVTVAAIWPLFKPETEEAESRAAHDVEVYTAQLAELKSDLERGVIDADEAQTARAEIGRRLLKAGERAKRSASGRQAANAEGSGRRGLLAATGCVAIMVPILSAFLYARIGGGGLPDEPLDERAAQIATNPPTSVLPANGGAMAGAPKPGDVASILAAAEARLKQNPQDGQGWDALAPIYLRLERNGDAVEAYRRSIALNGPSAAREGGLGEALTQAAGGAVTPAATAAFERSLKIDGDYLPARFFLALGLSQKHDFAAAEKAWTKLLAMSTKDAPWRPIAEAARADAAKRSAGEAPSPDAAVRAKTREPAETGTGPSAVEVDAASQMRASDRQAMIDGMVSRLAARLKADPDDLEGWKRLIRSYTVLGEREKAARALAAAAGRFDDDPQARQELASFGAQLGLSEGKETTNR